MTVFISLDNIINLGNRFSNEKLWFFIKENIDKIPLEHRKLIKLLICTNLNYQDKKELELYNSDRYRNYNYPYLKKLSNNDFDKKLNSDDEINLDNFEFQEQLIIMKNNFHPVPLISQWFNEKSNLKKFIYKLCEKLKQTPPSIPTNVFELYEWINWYNSLVIKNNIKGKKIVDVNRNRRRNGEKKKLENIKSKKRLLYKKIMMTKIKSKRGLNNCDKRDTYRIEYKVPKADIRDELFRFNVSRKIARSYYYWLGKLQGRWMNYFKPVITAEGAIVDKANLFWNYINKNFSKKCDIMTLIFAMHVVCNWSRRKEFTLMEQGHSGLDFTGDKLFEVIKDSVTTDWNLLGHLMISEDIYRKLSQEELMEIENKYRSQLDLYVKFLEWQWNIGVAIQAKKHMVMPKKDTTKIDTNGWNKVQGAYNKCIKALRVISKVLNIEGPKAYNCIALIANDQMGMAKRAEKIYNNNKDENKLYGERMNVGLGGVPKVFKRMARNHLPPWIGWQNPEIWPRVIEMLSKNCEELLPEFNKRGIKTKDAALGQFIGITNDIKLVADKLQENMICGVVVGNITEEMKTELELVGFAGANVYGNADNVVKNDVNYII